MEVRHEVVGIGSRLRADDAIGLHLVRNLKGQPGVRTHLLEDRDALEVASLLLELTAPVLLVDCADMGLGGGQWRVFGLNEAELRSYARTVSTHGLGLAEALKLALQLGLQLPVRIFGVQPFSLAFKACLSPPMTACLAPLQEALRQQTRSCHAPG